MSEKIKTSNKKNELLKSKNSYNDEKVTFINSSEVKDGVVCDVYSFDDDSEKDLGIIKVRSGEKTPLQKVISGDQTLEIFESGSGVLTITGENGKKTEYAYPGGPEQVEVKVGELMQWEAYGDLVFAEICYPPYKDGRFENIEQ